VFVSNGGTEANESWNVETQGPEVDGGNQGNSSQRGGALANPPCMSLLTEKEPRYNVKKDNHPRSASTTMSEPEHKLVGVGPVTHKLKILLGGHELGKGG